MKRIMLIGMVLCMALVFNGCVTKIVDENRNNISKEERAQREIDVVCRKIEFNQQNNFDVNHDGVKEVISIISPEVNDGDYRTISISINDTTTEIIEAESYGDAYLLQNEQGNIGLLFDAWWSNDFSKTYIFQIDQNMEVIRIDEIEGNIVANSVTSSALTIENYINLFGSWYGTCKYEITSDLKLSAVEDFMIKNDDERYITSKEDLVVDVKEGEIWTNKKLNGNKRLYPIYTDNTEYIYFMTEEGGMVRIKFTRVDYQVYVNDIVIEELFDGVEVAG